MADDSIKGSQSIQSIGPGQKGLVSIVIPNWNGKHFLKACLDSLIKQSYADIEILIVDNGSKDGSV